METGMIEERLGVTYRVLAARTRCDVDDPVVLAAWHRDEQRFRRRRVTVGIAALVLAFGVAVATWVVRDGDATTVGSSPTARRPIDLERTAMSLPDGSVGWLAYRAASGPKVKDGTSAEEVHRVQDEFAHTLFPVTRKERSSSRRIGYYLPYVGFIPPTTVEDPGFNVDAAIAHGKCAPQTELTLVDGAIDCVTTEGHRLRGTVPPEASR